MFLVMFLSLYSSLIPTTFSNKFNQTTHPFDVKIEIGENQTFLLSYNVTSRFSYFITFRLFEQEQWKFGLFPPIQRSRLQTIEISYDYQTMIEDFYYVIICFHFLRSINDIDVQCKDIRYRYRDISLSNDEYLPSYKPLFVPLMYALSVLMLLPVIVQHRRQKRAQFLQRRKELRRLSLNLTQENSSRFVRINENGTNDSKTIPIQIELLSFPSTRTLFDQIDDNDNVTFRQKNDFHPYFSSGNEVDDDEEIGISADECIAHLLNNAPWMTGTSTFRIPEKYFLHEQEIPMISATEHYDDHRIQQHSTLQMFRSNPAFIESDV